MPGNPLRTPALSLTLFFLKTFFFNPLNNPAFLASTVVIVFFSVIGSLDKYHVALVLYLAVLSHLYVGNMFRNREEESGDAGAPVVRYFRGLPIPGRRMYFSYVLASAIYAGVTYSVLGLLLFKLMQLPDLVGLEFVRMPAPDGDTLTVVRGFGVSARGVHFPVSFVLERSFLFDAAAGIRNGWYFLSAYYLFVFLYLSAYQVHRQLRKRRSFLQRGILCSLPLAFYSLLGIAFASELILTQKETGIFVRLVLGHPEITRTVFLAVAAITVLSALWMSRSIAADLGDYR